MGKTYLAGVISGLAGGVMGAWLLGHAGGPALPAPAAAVVATAPHEAISARRIELVDGSGRRRAEMALSPDGGPALFFYDSSGRNRLVLGLYAPAESEYPFVVLNDTRQQAAGIFRLFGSQETPVVVLKHQGRDRSVYGLNPASIEPFLVNYPGDGTKSRVFGDF